MSDAASSGGRGSGDDGAQHGADDRGSAFAAERPRLLGLAYRMLGSLADAEDVVSEAWLRFDRTSSAEEIRNPAAWLTTTTSRLAIDRLRAQQRRREDYVGPWLPEPVATVGVAATPSADPSGDPEASAELAESLTLGFLVVLDRLNPVERAVFLLADVFGVPFAEIAMATERTPEACRQIASRARRKVREGRRSTVAADEALLADLVGAFASGQVERLMELLAPDVVVLSDGGPDRRAARRPVVGADRVARLLVNLSTRTPPDADIRFESVNAAPALVVRSPSLDLVLTADSDEEGRVRAIRVVLNPDKLGALDDVPELT